MILGRFYRLLPLLLLVSPQAFAAPPPVLDFSVISRDESHSGECALTFDDGPGERTDALLDILAKRAIKATFFVLGKHVVRYPEVVRRMVAVGHEVDNHSYDHPDMRLLSAADRAKEIDQTEDLLRKLGARPHFFRPPYGAYDAALVQQAERDGLEVVLWSHDSKDWRYHTVADIEGNVMPTDPHHGAHGVFLFHDIHDSTITAMPAILDALKGSGCRFVTMAEWMRDNVGP